ncbi:unnamed protein product [Urochloa humidicola]
MDGVMQNQQQSPAQSEMPRDSAPAAGRVDEEEWVTVFGACATQRGQRRHRPRLGHLLQQPAGENSGCVFLFC